MSAELSVLLPLFGATLAWIVGPRIRGLTWMIVSLGTLISAINLRSEVLSEGAYEITLGGWSPPLGISLNVDGLAVFMLAMTSVVGLLVGWYALGYFHPSNGVSSAHENELFWPLFLLAWAGLNGLFLSGDLFNIYVMFELIGLTGVALITLTGKLSALTAAMRYLLAAFMGSLCYLMGVALLYAGYGKLDYLSLGMEVVPSTLSTAAFSLMACGLLLKTALFPLHFWLPPAHSNSSPPVSALLSAVIVKASYYVFLRLWFQGVPTLGTPELGQFLGVLASFAIIWGSIQALRQKKLKLLIAHSTVAQIGYLFLLFPLTSGPPQEAFWLEEAYIGTLYHLLAHALAKAAMFLAAGVVFFAYGAEKITGMRGLAGRFPVTAFALALSGVTIVGLPPSGGFVAKWMILKAVVASGQWWWAPVILLGGLLGAGYVFLMLRYAFKAGQGPEQREKVTSGMEWAALSLALASILIGVWLEGPLSLLSVGGPLGGRTLD